MSSFFPYSQYWSWGTFILYVVISLIVIILTKISCYTNNFKIIICRIKKRKYTFNGYYIIAFIILVALASLRNMYVGPDTNHYVTYFLNSDSFYYDWSRFFEFKLIEPGFFLYQIIIRKITDNYTIYFFITYSFVATAYLRFINYYFSKESSWTIILLFIYYYVLNMSGMRSAIGSVFIIESFISLNENKYIKSIILTLFGILFHYTI